MKNLRKIKMIYSALAAILILLGICLVMKPELSLTVICRLAGVLFIIYGFVKIGGYFSKDIYELAFQFDFAMGLFSLAVGCALIFFVDGILLFFPAFIGVIILTDAVFKIQTSLDAKRFGLQKWWLILLLAVLAGIAGFLLIIYPQKTSQLIIMFVGLNLIIDGLLNLWIVIYTVKILGKIEKQPYENIR